MWVLGVAGTVEPFHHDPEWKPGSTVTPTLPQAQCTGVEAALKRLALMQREVQTAAFAQLAELRKFVGSDQDNFSAAQMVLIKNKEKMDRARHAVSASGSEPRGFLIRGRVRARPSAPPRR